MGDRDANDEAEPDSEHHRGGQSPPRTRRGGVQAGHQGGGEPRDSDRPQDDEEPAGAVVEAMVLTPGEDEDDQAERVQDDSHDRGASSSHTTSSSAETRVALIGYGLAGRLFHGRFLAAAPGLRVTSIMTGNAGRQAEAEADFPQATVLSAVDQLWDNTAAFDLVVVATSTPSHVPLAQRAIELGKHVVVEKPLAATAARARSLVELAESRGVLLVPFLNRRWDSDHLTVQRLLREQALGQVLRYESRFDRWRPEPKSGAWREELAATEGGGVLLDLGPHLVDQALTLHGAVTDVHAEVFARRGGADDDVFIALQHASGVTSHLWANALAAAPGPRLRVLGSRGAYVVQGLDGQEEALRSGRRPDQPGFGAEPRERWGRLMRGDEGTEVAPEAGDWLHFYTTVERCLRGQGPPPVTAADAVAGLEVLDAARESARTGSAVQLTPGGRPVGHG